LKLVAKFGFAVVLRALIAGLALQAPASAGVANTLTLKPVAQVATDEVMLRDLVGGGDASLNADIVICHAPAVGSVRTLSLAEVAAALKKHELAYLLRGPEQISVMRVSREVSAADLKPLIEAALSKNDASATIGGVHLQAVIFVNDTAGIKLHKLRFDPAINKYRAWFVASDAPHAVSFEAMATLEHGVAPQEIKLSNTGQLSSAVSLSVRRGESAAMQLTGEGFSATLTVICLEDGVEANTVRVREPASKRIYRARIIGQGLLRAVGREN
jgi:Chaperone for flagella basal body P-ring formation